MKIFIVSEAGKIADVTLHTSCKSADESALKVPISAMRKRLYIQPWLKERRGVECIASKFYRVMLCCSPENNCSGLFILHLCIHRRLRNTRSAECRSQNQIRNFFRPGT